MSTGTLPSLSHQQRHPQPHSRAELSKLPALLRPVVRAQAETHVSQVLGHAHWRLASARQHKADMFPGTPAGDLWRGRVESHRWYV